MPPTPGFSSTTRAALWMLGWLTLMITIAIAGREASHELALFQIMEMRSVIGILLLAPLARRAGGCRLEQRLGVMADGSVLDQTSPNKDSTLPVGAMNLKPSGQIHAQRTEVVLRVARRLSLR